MATASVPYTFTNGTQNADATQVNSNFSNIVNFLNAEVIQRDGSVAFTAIPTLPASNPSNDNHAVRKAYVDAFLPAGTIVDYGGSTAPSGWVLCDGSSYSSTNATYSRLFSAIGTTYGGSAGNFNVPDLRGRVAVGKAASGTFGTLAASGGSETVTLTTAQLPSHTHSIDHDHASATTSSSGLHSHTTQIDSTTGAASAGSTGLIWEGGVDTGGTSGTSMSTNSSGSHTHTVDLPNFTGTSGAAGSGSAVNVTQPYIVTNKIIKL